MHAMIVNATDLSVSADLERGFGDAPEAIVETIRLAAEAGLGRMHNRRHNRPSR
jgi:2-methylisocitrate lyase-like PEP mutase family enzyme